MENKERLYLTLPNGETLVAYNYGDEDFPSIDIFIEKVDGEHEKICFVEYNPERAKGKEVCIGIYAPNTEDTIYYESYVDGVSDD